MTRRARNVTLIAGGLVLAVLLVVVALLPVPYVRARPANIMNALGELDGEQIITIDGAKTYPTDGSLNVTAVIEDGGPGSSLTLLQAFQGWLDPGMRVKARDWAYPPEVFEDEDAAEKSAERGAAEMASSEQLAAVAALRHLGKPVSTQVLVDSVEPEFPAEGILRSGDQIVELNGVTVDRYADVARLMAKVAPGDSVTLLIERDGKQEELVVDTVPAPDDPKTARMGVTLGVGFDSPVEVNIALGDVGGPSGGLMFALSIIDKLTPGSLTGGRDIAGTGTIDPSGTVGAIGGIAQKMAGAADAGAEIFLAPEDNCPEVVGHVPDGLQVVAVNTLDEAVDALQRLENGDTDLPGCPG